MISTQEGAGSTESQSVFRKVGECLDKHESSGADYGLVKRCGKQFRRSLKTTDRVLANRRLSELREKVGRLSNAKSARRITFIELAERWFGTVRGNLKPLSAGRVQTCLDQIKPYFADGGRMIRRPSALSLRIGRTDELNFAECHDSSCAKPPFP